MAAPASWYYLQHGRTEGPVTSGALLDLFEAGALDRQTSIWSEGASDWQPLERALGLSRPPPPPSSHPLPPAPPSPPPPPSAAAPRPPAMQVQPDPVFDRWDNSVPKSWKGWGVRAALLVGVLFIFFIFGFVTRLFR